MNFINELYTSKTTISNDAIEVESNATKQMYDENYIGNVNDESEVIVQIQLEGYQDYYISNMGRVFRRWRSSI